MSLICVAAATGSPGATTTSLALLACLPTTSGNQKRLLLETNMDGGSLAIRYGRSVTPGLTNVAAAERHELNIEKIFEHAQKLPGGTDVILAPDSSKLVGGSLQMASPGIAKILSGEKNLTTVIDCGRLQSTSPVLDFCRAADLMIMVVRPDSEYLIPASHILKELKEENPNLQVGWVLVGETPYDSNEVIKTFGIPVFGTIANDKKGAGMLKSGGNPKKLEKSKLMKSIRILVEQLSKFEKPTLLQKESDTTEEKIASPKKESDTAKKTKTSKKQSRHDKKMIKKERQKENSKGKINGN